MSAAHAHDTPARPKALGLGPRTRRLIRSVARVVNPLVLRFAGGRHMPVLGVLHHRGRRTGQEYATPLGSRPAAGGGFVIPLTFGEAAGWYRNIRAAGRCVITWRGSDPSRTHPGVLGPAAAAPRFPREGPPGLPLVGGQQFGW